jgi:hypothetical protein
VSDLAILLRVVSRSAACQDLAGKGNAHNELFTEWNTQSTIMAPGSSVRSKLT